MMELAEHVAETFSGWGSDCEVYVESIDDFDYRLIVVSEGFETLRHIDRQDAAWKIATGADWLQNDEGYNVKVIWTLTPGEMELACALAST